MAGRIREFATLKAMGYRDGKLSSVVLVQAWLVAILGYVPGLLLAVALYWLAADNAAIPISMTPIRLALVFGLALAMCSFSGLLAARKLATADPADLF